MPYGYGASKKHYRKMKIKSFMKSAVRGVKSFVVNKAMGYANTSSLISNFTSATNFVKSGNIEGINTLLKKSPFEKTLGNTSTNPMDDPLGFHHLQYPTDLTGAELGNWILFFSIATNVGDNPSFNSDLELGETLNVNPKSRWVGPGSPHDLGTSEGGHLERIDQVREHYKTRNITIPRMNKTNTVLGDDATKDIVSGAIALYMPNDIKVGYGADWGIEESGFSGDIAAGMRDIKKFNINNIQTPEGQADLMQNFVGQAGGVIAKGAADMAGSLGAGAGMGDFVKLIGKNFGVALNNRKEVFYEGPQFREFNYSFAFWPRNPDETERIQKIIKMFKYHMHPWKDTDWGGRIFRYPSEFEIHYLHRTGINSHLNKISRCALHKCDVTYVPASGNFKTFEDNAPVTYKVDLGFKELEYMTKQKIKEGF